MVDLNGFKKLRSELNQLPRELTQLPSEAFSQVAKVGCPYDNPREAGIFLANLKLVSHEIHDKFTDSTIGTFDARLSKLAALHGNLSDKILPEMPDDTPEANQHFATMQIPAIQPVLKFYEPSAQTAIVNHLMTTNDWEKTAAAACLSTNLNDFHGDGERTTIINQALSSFEADDPAIRTNAGTALVRASSHLDPAQQARLSEVLQRNPQLRQEYNQLMREQQEWYREQRVKLPSSNLDESIKIIAAEVAGLPAGLSSMEQVATAHKVAKSITESYNCAHNELMNLSRSRERSSLGR
ncbi:hypothetical protein RLEG12_00390 (plasmid) [Rhizobium leguminosarum bv. trifolii CB782]|nr:hypothetical protein RLEG12_00390 [Rhizobium leguminosarum bv. trifolii CB782]